MNRNQKIALGCGGAGCLGLILIVIVVVVLSALGYMSLPGTSRNRNYNFNANSNRNSNYNSNYNRTSTNDNSSSSTLSDDDKHKLFQAAGMTKDNELIQRVLRKLGFLTASGISDDYSKFVKDHFAWAMKNIEFVQSVNDAQKARAYVDAHIDD